MKDTEKASENKKKKIERIKIEAIIQGSIESGALAGLNAAI